MTETRATRADVARLAGVSTATVSYVVNKGPRPVSADKQARVLRAVAELDYVPNDFARSLKGAGSHTIGYLVPNIRNPFFAEMTYAFNRTLRQHGYHLLLADLDNDPSREPSYLDLFRKKGVDGVVAWQTSSSGNLVDYFNTRRIPFALVATRHKQASSVVIDEQRAAELLVAYLADLGHRRIAYLGPGDGADQPNSRLPFIAEALAKAGLSGGPGLFFDFDSDEGLTETARRIADQAARPTALIVHNDDMAIKIIARLFDLGVKVPEELSVAGYDNIEFGQYAKVPLTSISYSKEALGQGAIELVLEQIGNRESPRLRTLEVPVELIVRGSTAAPPPSGP